MKYVVALVLVAFLLRLVVGAVRGRVKVDPCCAPADPRRDARMRAAFADPPVRDAGQGRGSGRHDDPRQAPPPRA